MVGMVTMMGCSFSYVAITTCYYLNNGILGAFQFLLLIIFFRNK